MVDLTVIEGALGPVRRVEAQEIVALARVAAERLRIYNIVRKEAADALVECGVSDEQTIGAIVRSATAAESGAAASALRPLHDAVVRFLAAGTEGAA